MRADFAEAGTEKSETAEPVDLLGLELVFPEDEEDIDLEPVPILEQFLDPIVQFQERADQDQAVMREADIS